MRKTKHKQRLCLLFIICLLNAARAQQCISMFPQPYYDCLTGLAVTNYTLSGGTAPYSYTIVNAANGATIANGAVSTTTGTMTALGQGNYNFYISDPFGCSAIIPNYQVTANLLTTAANASITTSSVTCYGANNGSATIIPPTSFSANPGFTWMPGNVNTATISNMIGGQAYTVTVRDERGCETKSVISVPEPPPIYSGLTATYIPCYGGSLNTLITSTGIVGPTNYSINGAPCLGSSATNLPAGLYTITTRDGRPCLATHTVLITQGAKPLVNVPANFRVSPTCPGGSDGSMAAVVSNVSPPYTYTWSPGGGNGFSYAGIPAGNYTLTVGYGTSSPGCYTSMPVTLAPAVAATVQSVTQPENCSAADGAFTVNVSGASSPFSYTLYSAPTVSSVVTNVANGLSSGVYTLLTRYRGQCVDTTQIVIGNLSTVVMTIQNSVAVSCYGSCNASVTLNVLNGVPPLSFSTAGFPATGSNMFGNLCSGFRTFRVIDGNGCPATVSLSIPSPSPLNYSVTGPSSLCVGQTGVLQATANGGTGNHTFIWQPGNLQGSSISVMPVNSGVYSLTAYDANGCTLGPKTLSVQLAQPLSVQITAAGSGICPGSTAQITPTVSGGDGAYSYFWIPGGNTSPSIFVDNIAVPVYTVIVKDGCGSPPAIKRIPISLFPTTKPLYTVKGPVGCVPFCVRFINTTPKSKLPMWSFGEKPGLNTGDTANYCYLSSGKFDVTLSVVDSNSCRSSFTYTNAIEVKPSPSADFVVSQPTLTLFSADDIVFPNCTQNAKGYQWYVDERYQGNSRDLKYSFADTGYYRIRLIATNISNCYDTTDKIVYVQEDFAFYMPNSFTPNGNGTNDVLMPKGTGWQTEGYLFQVFDRWGRLLFSTGDARVGWNGTYPGGETPYDIYIWKATVYDLKRKEHHFAGSGNLIR